MLYIGIDLGTSACKFLLMDETGDIKNIVSRDYPLSFPKPGWSEQDPAAWVRAVEEGIAEERLGRNPIFFLPYLMGERSPINDTDARAAFIGMSLDTERRDLVQALFEGVAFGMRDSLEVARQLGIRIERSKICGGGAKSPLWRKIFANVMNVKLDILASEQGPGMGGAMLAMVACGVYPSVADAAAALVRVVETVEPEPALAARYEERYQKYCLLYPALKAVFPKLH